MKPSSNGLCGNSPVTVHAFADNELNAKDWLAFKEHLSACPDCFAAYRRILALKALFKHSLLQYRAPAPLRIEIVMELQAVNKQALAEAPGAKSWAYALLSRRGLIWKEWKKINRIAPALAASLVIAVTLTFFLSGPSLEDEIIAKYKRSLAVSLASNSPPAASLEENPRLTGAPGFVLPIPDLTASGFAYRGARLDQIAQHSGEVLIYSNGSYVIHIFIWPSEGELLGTVSKEGYNIIHWTWSDLKFCAISTMSANELSKFQEIFASKLSA